MLEREVEIMNRLGLHARAAARLVRMAGKFRSRIMLRRQDNGVTANAKSILGVLHIAAQYGVILLITADGDDEIAAMEAIDSLFATGFGE